ncbi:hypothetical protein OCH239_21350 [Roseivivax halodurans JCM 10272]|uniref:CDP-alcohol phosphatidyltransferase n=1 Tax=Roseivivax halodurans JCM 10272 TaxID=1449350 RepID=X7E3X7_9RHOB|nr:CDP-alcohol phosphatidyltransferase family protein [Roseivivax halodurans]ETX10769.1 hypothetical protein OCH239_21350 [Roseivivax halodurans JCM 10272]
MEMSFIAHEGENRSKSRLGPASPGAALAIVAVLGSLPMVATIVAITGREAEAVIAGLGFLAAGSIIACCALLRDAPHDRLGIANVVTLVRLLVVSVLVACLAARPDGTWTFVALAALALSLDGVDGWIARRQNMTSRFGARFDMEADSALALVLAIHASQAPEFGAVALLLGVPRYAFGFAMLVLPRLRGDLPDRLSRKAVCVFQIATLIAIQVPFLPASVGQTLVAVALVSLALSFGRDIQWLRRRRA